MAADIVIALLFGDENYDDNDEEDVQVIRIARKRMRDENDPFTAPESQFRAVYRLLREACERERERRALIEELRPLMPVKRRSTAIPIELQILASISFLASGSYQRRAGQDFLACMSQTSISTSLHATVHAINGIMKNWICFPLTVERIQNIKKRIFRQNGIPGRYWRYW